MPPMFVLEAAVNLIKEKIVRRAELEREIKDDTVRGFAATGRSPMSFGADAFRRLRPAAEHATARRAG